MKRTLKIGRWMGFAAVLALAAGCGTVDLSKLNPDVLAVGLTPSNVVSVATNWLGNQTVITLANGIMSDPVLVENIQKAWAEFAAHYDLPDQLDAGGGDEVQADSSTALPVIGGGKTITGWAPVNHWWNMDDAVIEDGLAYMQSCNVRWFSPEAVGNAGEDVLGNPAKLERMKSRWLFTQRICKERGIWFAPILFNDNAGDGAYQNGGVKLEKRLAQAKALIDWVAANGDKSVLSITLVAETQTSAGSALENYGAQKLAGFRIDYNHNSRPSSKPSWATGLVSWHVCDLNSWPKANTIWMNDCGTSIRQLNMGGDLNGVGDPAKIEKKKNEAVARGQYVFTVYGFQVQHFDKPTIKALSMPYESGGSSTGSDTATGWPSELSSVTWLHTNVRDWPVTTTVAPSVSGNTLRMPFDKTIVWPTAQIDGGAVNANPWAIVKWTDGKWYAGTFEWLRKGDPNKGKGVLDHTGGKGDHFKVSPLNKWTPKSGERFYIMVSGLARSNVRNVKERSEPAEIVWP